TPQEDLPRLQRCSYSPFLRGFVRYRAKEQLAPLSPQSPAAILSCFPCLTTLTLFDKHARGNLRMPTKYRALYHLVCQMISSWFPNMQLSGNLYKFTTPTGFHKSAWH